MKTVQYLNCSHLLTSCSTSCVQLHPMYLAGECPPRWDFSVLLESTFLTTASFLPRYVCFGVVIVQEKKKEVESLRSQLLSSKTRQEFISSVIIGRNEYTTWIKSPIRWIMFGSLQLCSIDHEHVIFHSRCT